MVTLGINGLGRIGRCVVRQALDHPDIDIVAANDITDKERAAYHLKYDTVHGRLNRDITAGEETLQIGDRELPLYHKDSPSEIPWDRHDPDIVLESTGVFRRKEQAAQHLDAGAGRVLISAPAKGNKADEVPSIVYGVNNDNYQGEDIADCASCTTNSLAPMAKILHDEFGIRSGLMTTIHAYTGSQKLVDAATGKIRRGRAAAENIVPTTTGAAQAVTDVIPELEGRLDAMAMRVPVPNGSISDLVVTLDADVTAEQINQTFQDYAENTMDGVLGYSEDPLVSSDIVGTTESCIIDADSTNRTGEQIKVLGWYDNEYGYASRMLDVAQLMAGR
ncbi:MAG: type I glyceraldehyde-3-phosphate dehydrogenase [Candidatus Nanohaloarchaea archaeon]|nr:type I glyceraldehyde-3-phosphate dehydrogenase [Candidatus Nanohaloarchaea archaeon]